MDRKREEKQKLECVRCAYCIETNTVILNWQKPLWEGD
jgi:hypothetical protein